MQQNISGESFSSTTLNPQGKRLGSLNSSIQGLVVAGLGRFIQNCAYDSQVRLTITSKKYKFPLHETIFFTIAGTEAQLYAFQQAVSRGLQSRT